MITCRQLAALLAPVLLAAACAAQAYTPPPPPLDAPCKPTKKDPCTVPAADKAPAGPTLAFPFPADTSGAVKLDPNADPNDPANNPPTNPPASGDGSGKFPFPGDAPAGSPSSSGSSSSSSSSSSGSSSSAPVDPSTAPDDDDSPAPTPSTRRKLPKVEDLGAREAEDVEVSSYYFSAGDYKAAYSRGKDAVRISPDDPEAHFALAQAASRLNKVDEARKEYETSLKLDIVDKRAKVAREQLEKLPTSAASTAPAHP